MSLPRFRLPFPIRLLPLPPVDVYVCSYGEQSGAVLRIRADTGDVSTIPGGSMTVSLAADDNGNAYLAERPGTGVAGFPVVELPAAGGAQKTLTPGFIANSVAVDWAGNVYAIGYSEESDDAPYQAVKVPADGAPWTVLWSGSLSDEYPAAIAVDGFLNAYVVSPQPPSVVKIPASGGPQTVIDLTGVLSTAPTQLAVEPSGQHVYIPDAFADKVVKVPVNGGAPTNVGTGLSGPQGVAVDGAGNVYIADTFNNRVVMVSAEFSGSQFTICRTATPVPVAVQPTPIFYWLDGLGAIGKLLGGAADAGGWLVIGDHFIPIPLRSPLMAIIARAAAPYLGRAIQNPEVGAEVRKLH
jgi:hypothetical protein